MLSDKSLILQILGGLMKKPILLAQVDKYFILPDDFSSAFERNIFSAIYNLHQNGATRISVIDIDTYLESHPGAHSIFVNQNGIEYLNDCEEMSQVENFDYYYQRFKKFNCLNDLEKLGYDVSRVYSYEKTDEAKKINERFETLSIQDIIAVYKKDISSIEHAYQSRYDNNVVDAAADIDNLIQQLKITPEVGSNLPGHIINTILRGARKGKFYVKSAASGVGKALPNSTLIPTISGWKTVGEINKGDYLFDRLGNPTKVLEVYPQGEKEVFEVTFSDGRIALCNDEHLWSYYNYRQTKLNTSTLKEIMNDKSFKNSHGFKYKIPIAQGVKYEEKIFSIPPYIMGLILGDGSFRQQKTNKAFQFSSEDDTLPKVIAKTMNWNLKKGGDNNFTWYFSDKNNQNIYIENLLKDYSNMINLYSKDKFIPEDYLVGSEEQRWELLKGLLDTDGSVDLDKGRISFFTVSNKLKDNVVLLCRSLGIITSILEDRREDKYTKTGVCYRITLQASFDKKEKMFNLERKKERVSTYLSKVTRHEKKNSISIVNIKSLNRKEEMTCFMVDNKEHLFLMNDYIVTHNTRGLVGDACYLAYPIRYDNTKRKWVKEGSNEKILYIVTEQDSDEIQTLILSYLSDVDEEKILYGNYTAEEEERIKQAAKVMKGYKDNFIIAKIPDPSITQVQSVVRKYFFENNIDNLFYDYIFSSPSLLAEFRDLRVREDVALLMLSTALKNLASELDIFVASSTQLNRSTDEGKNGVRNQNNIRGAISIIDKVDVAYIFDRTTADEIEALSSFIESSGMIPNQVADLYKVRRSRFTNVRIWSYFDYGTCRKKDLFITSGNFAPVSDFNSIFFMDGDDDVSPLLRELNGEVPKLIEAAPMTPVFEVKRKEVNYF